MIISTHSHLCSKPKDLDRLVNSGIFRQIWLLHTWYAHDDQHQDAPYAKATPEELLAVCRDYSGFFIPFGCLDFTGTPDHIDRLFDAGFVGLKAIAPEKPYDDYSYFSFYERASYYKMPIVFHTGGIALGRDYVGPNRSFGQNTMKPSMLGAIAHSFPDLTLIGAHLGYPWMEETTNILNCKNIYFDMSEGNSEAIARWLVDNLDRRTVDGRSYTEKILFGIDARIGRKEIHDDVFESAHFWESFFRRFGRCHNWGRPEEIEKIMLRNALSIQFPENPKG